MPVRKFRSIAEMDAARSAIPRSTPVDWEEVARVLDAAAAANPRRLVPGVYKHRTVEAWNAQTDLWEQADVERAIERTRRAAEGPAA